MILVILYLKTDDITVAKDVFGGFYALNPLLDTTSVRPFMDLCSMLDEILPHGPRTYMTAFSYTILTDEMLQASVDTFDTFLNHVGDDYRGGAIFFEGFSFDKTVSVPADATAYGSRGKHFNCVPGFRWSKPEHDKWSHHLLQNFVSQCRTLECKVLLAQGKTPTVENGYANFHLPATPVAQAFQGNLARLIEVKRKWDPNARFNKWLNIST